MAFLFLYYLQRVLSYCNLEAFIVVFHSTAELVQTYLLDLEASSALLYFPQKTVCLEINTQLLAAEI